MDEAIRKKVLQMIPSPICVVGCKSVETVHAFVGSWLGQCSFTPTLLWVAVRQESRPIEMFRVGKYFSMSILSAEQEKIARAFLKTPEPKNNKFGKIPYHLTEKGLPILDECLSWVECKIVGKATPGDHILFYGELINCGLNQNAPVLTTANSKMKYGG